MQFLHKYDKISLFGQICQHEVSCRPGFVEQRTCITNGGGVAGCAAPSPPPFEKHGQRSAHTGFLTVHRLFCFASCLHYENSGGVGGGRSPPPLLQNMDEVQNTYIFLHPSDGCVLQCVLRCCDVFDLRGNCYLQYAYSSKRRKYSNLKHSFVALKELSML